MAKRQRGGVIFDLDGTLLDSLKDIAISMNLVLEAAGFPQHSQEAYRFFVGDGVRTLVERSVPERVRQTENLEPLIEALRAKLAKNWRHHTQPYPGIVDLLAHLRQAIPNRAVLSNKPHHLTVAHVEHFFPNQVFQWVLGVSEEVPPKPNLTGAHHILSKWDVAPKDILYVGDTGTDMQTAKAAGFFAVGVTWGFRSAAELKVHGADVLIDHPQELEAYY